MHLNPPNHSLQAVQGERMLLTETWLVDLSHLLLVLSSSCNVLIFLVQVGSSYFFYYSCYLSPYCFLSCSLLILVLILMQDLRFRSLLAKDLKRVLLIYRFCLYLLYYYSCYLYGCSLTCNPNTSHITPATSLITLYAPDS